MYSEDNHSLAIAKDCLNASHVNKKTNKHQALIAAKDANVFYVVGLIMIDNILLLASFAQRLGTSHVSLN